jgi:amino-acid N-acetyltransferase
LRPPAGPSTSPLAVMVFRIVPAPFTAQVRELLRASALPAEDLAGEPATRFYVSRSGDELVGVVGLELYGEAALLRSLAVARSVRGQGLGAALVRYAEEAASTQNARALYLLTMSAERFFIRLGYRNQDRRLAPESIASTQQFSALCPSSAAFMMKEL